MTTILAKHFPTLLIIALVNGCGGSDKPAAGAGGGMPPPPEVDVMTVTKGRATITQDLPGRLQAYRTAQVRARIEGVVEKRLFQEGSDVQEGVSLFQIDPRNYRAAAASAKADLEIARQNVERYKPLLEIGAVSQLEYDLAVAKAKQAEAASVSAVQDMENTRVPAAISGRIGRSLVTEGALVGKGEATLLATIEQLDPIYVNFTQSGSDLLRLRQAFNAGTLQHADAAKVELLQDDGSVYPILGKIFFTDMAVDPGTGSVTLRAQFSNPKHDLLPGTFVRLRFPEAVAVNVIRIPQRAIQMGTQGQFVMAVGAENKVMPMPVKVGSMAGGDFIIDEGLKGGEQIIVNGLQKARPGAVVTPVSADGGPKPVPSTVKETKESSSPAKASAKPEAPKKPKE